MFEECSVIDIGKLIRCHWEWITRLAFEEFHASFESDDLLINIYIIGQ